MGLRRPPCAFYYHLDGDVVVVIVALQFLENNSEDCGCAYENSVLEPSGHVYVLGEIILSVRHRRIAIYAVGYDVVQVVRLVVVDPMCRQVAVDLPARSVVSQAVAARSARLADAAHEPLFGYEVGVVDGPAGILVLLPVFIHLS